MLFRLISKVYRIIVNLYSITNYLFYLATITKRQFWQQRNRPIELWSTSVIKQKLDYIHNNPIASGFVVNPEDWRYSSTVNFNSELGVLDIDDLVFVGENKSF